MSPVIQMRIFTIGPGEMDDWISEWTAKVLPLREEAGFGLVSAWTISETNQFVWFLRYDGAEPFEAADKAYYQSAERRGLDPDPARHVVEAHSWFVTPLEPESTGERGTPHVTASDRE
jgi:hypothetical protein